MQHTPIPGIAAQKCKVGLLGLVGPALLMQREGLFQRHAVRAPLRKPAPPGAIQCRLPALGSCTAGL
jgi:hypothetical protein